MNSVTKQKMLKGPSLLIFCSNPASKIIKYRVRQPKFA